MILREWIGQLSCSTCIRRDSYRVGYTCWGALSWYWGWTAGQLSARDQQLRSLATGQIPEHFKTIDVREWIDSQVPLQKETLLIAGVEIVGLIAFRRRWWNDHGVRRLQWVFVSWMRKCSYFGFSMANAIGILYLHTAVNHEVHPHWVHCLVVTTVLIIFRTWYVIPLYNMRLAVVINTLSHYVRR